jgi:hypothetical protein
MTDAFHDRLADHLYGCDDLNDQRALLADIDSDRQQHPVMLPEHCALHGTYLAEAHSGDQCPECEAAYDRLARADAEFDLRDYRPGNASTNY